MKTLKDAKTIIVHELTSDDSDVRSKFLEHFGNDIENFAEAMAKTLFNWRSLDDQIRGNKKQAYVSAWVYTAINLHIISTKLFLSGYIVPAGNLCRQVVETMALALLCSSKELNVLDRFIANQYSTNKAIDDLIRQAKKVGVNKNSAKILGQIQKFYHQYSHPNVLTIIDGMSFSKQGLCVGTTFDNGKLQQGYAKEIQSRVNLAKVFNNFVDGIKFNVAKW